MSAGRGLEGHLSQEQHAVATGTPLSPLSVVACAGSGKTKTAVALLREIRERIPDSRGRVALLSFSNVAVETFRRGFAETGRARRSRVTIETVDSFFTSAVLRPHGHTVMNCPGTPFLLTGSESFLRNPAFKFWVRTASGKKFPVDAGRVDVSLAAGAVSFSYEGVPVTNGPTVAALLGARGAYTHDLGRYWVHKALSSDRPLLRALARRYPFVIVDEAQDIGAFHRILLEMLATEGCVLTLVGDPCQAIYEFAGADGTFLRGYSATAGVKSHTLTTNYRSIPQITAVAAAVSGSPHAPVRTSADPVRGAFLVGYQPGAEGGLVADFELAIGALDLSRQNSAVLCRARERAASLRGASGRGQGALKHLAHAALLRDGSANYQDAFAATTKGVAELLLDGDRLTQLLSAAETSGRQARRILWRFVRDAVHGIPPAGMLAKKEWQPALVAATEAILQELEAKCSVTRFPSVRRRISTKGLGSGALLSTPSTSEPLRVDTVHKAKGESLDAVLYIASESQIAALLNGVGTEEGRIGYVALTRARDLFWLAVPSGALQGSKAAAYGRGFQDWPGLPQQEGVPSASA